MKRTDIESRRVGLELFKSVLREKRSLDEAMARRGGFAKLEKRDRAFAHALAALVLRRLGQLDDVVRRCLDKPHEIKAGAQDILRLGAAQILFLGTALHAAVDTSVELAASDEATKPYKGLINAVLRRLTREGAAMVKGQDAARLNTPDWLWTSWRQAYGVAKAREIALANMTEAPLDLAVKEDAAFWARRLGGQLLPTGSVRLTDQTPLSEREGFAEGAWWVQDAAAALPALLMGDVRGKRVFDLCAAPGGKAMQLAAMGARVTAVDRSASRLERLKENLARLKLDVEIFCADALKWEPKEKADFILLDAPCSATGTIRRHPDVQRLKGPEDVARMVELQAKLLDRAAQDLLAPNGTLVYAVCSLQPEEAEEQVEKFLSRHPGFARKPIRPEEIGGAAELLTPAGDLRCLPCHWTDLGGLDGFYAARIKKAVINYDLAF